MGGEEQEEEDGRGLVVESGRDDDDDDDDVALVYRGDAGDEILPVYHAPAFSDYQASWILSDGSSAQASPLQGDHGWPPRPAAIDALAPGKRSRDCTSQLFAQPLHP